MGYGPFSRTLTGNLRCRVFHQPNRNRTVEGEEPGENSHRHGKNVQNIQITMALEFKINIQYTHTHTVVTSSWTERVHFCPLAGKIFHARRTDILLISPGCYKVYNRIIMFNIYLNFQFQGDYLNESSLFFSAHAGTPNKIWAESKKHKNTRNSYKTSIYNLYNYKKTSKRLTFIFL